MTSNCRFFQTPPDLVVKFQRVDIVDVILQMVVPQGAVSLREIKGMRDPHPMRPLVYH
jgi:hypothetical protein